MVAIVISNIVVITIVNTIFVIVIVEEILEIIFDEDCKIAGAVVCYREGGRLAEREPSYRSGD